MGDSLRELVVKLLGDDSDLQKKLGKAGDAIESFGKGTMKAGGVLTAGLTLPIIGMGVAAIKSAMDAQTHMAQTEAVIKSTGGAAGVTAAHVSDLSGELMQMSGVDDDAAQAGANMLLTFTNIKATGGVFDDAATSAVDLATALNNGVLPSGEQVQAQALQIGKALNNPIDGLTKLQRIGVTFSDDQVKLVQRLQDSGDMMGAQQVILAELRKEFGGSAQAAGQTFAGKLALLQNTLGNLGEEVGGKLLPALTNLATQATPFILRLIDAISTMSPTMLLVIGGVLAAAAALGPFLVVIGSIITAVGAILPVLGAVGAFLAGPFLLPVLAVVAGIAALIAIVVLLATHWQQVVGVIQGTGLFQFLAAFLPVVIGLFQQIGGIIAAQVAPILQQLGETLRSQLLPAWQGLQATFETIKPVLIAVGAIIGGILLVAIGLAISVIAGLAGALGGLLSAVIAVIGGVVQIISGGVQLVVGIFQTLVGLVKGIFTGDWTTLQDGLKTIKSGAMNIVGGLVSGITGLISGLVGAVGGLINGFVSTIVGYFTGLWNTLVGHSIIPDLVNGIIRWFAELPGRVGQAIMNMINLGIALFETLRAMAISKVQSLVNTAEMIAARLKDALTAPIRAAQGIIGGILANLSSMFSGLHLSLPPIKLPHFSIKGSFSLNPPSIPSIGVSWYKTGGIFMQPSIVGVGDVPEAVIPLNRLGDVTGGGGSSSGGGTPVEISIDGRVVVRTLLPILVDELRRAGAIRDI